MVARLALAAGIGLALLTAGGDAHAQSDGPRGGERLGAGVGLVLAGIGTSSAAAWLAADVQGGAGPGAAMGVASLVGVVVGVVEIVRGAGELRRPSPVAFGPGGLTVRF